MDEGEGGNDNAYCDEGSDTDGADVDCDDSDGYCDGGGLLCW